MGARSPWHSPPARASPTQTPQPFVPTNYGHAGMARDVDGAIPAEINDVIERVLGLS